MDKNPLLLAAKQRLAEINEIRKTLLVENLHYGVIPGSTKPVLLKPGAELFMSLYALTPTFHEEIEGVGLDRRITVTAEIKNAQGQEVGHGYGFASSLEDKFKWKKAGQEDYDAAPPEERRIVRTRRETLFFVRQNPDNVLNTVLKMARKRAMIDAVLTHFALSGYFTQDLEDDIAPVPPTVSAPKYEPPKETASPAANPRFLKAVTALVRTYGPDRLREAERHVGIHLPDLATRPREEQVAAYERVVKTLQALREKEAQEPDPFRKGDGGGSRAA